MKKLYTFENRWHQRYVSLLLMLIFFFIPITALEKIKEDYVGIVQMTCFGIYFASMAFIYLFTDHYVTESADGPEIS